MGVVAPPGTSRRAGSQLSPICRRCVLGWGSFCTGRREDEARLSPGLWPAVPAGPVCVGFARHLQGMVRSWWPEATPVWAVRLV